MGLLFFVLINSSNFCQLSGTGPVRGGVGGCGPKQDGVTSCGTLSWGLGEERDGNQQGLFLAISLVRPLDSKLRQDPLREASLRVPWNSWPSK